MKIKLPEKRFFTVQELAHRWGVTEPDVNHLIEVGELRQAIKFAALQGKRGVGFIRLGNRQKPIAVVGGDELDAAIADESKVRISVAVGDSNKTEDDCAWIGVYTSGNTANDFSAAIADFGRGRQEEYVVLLCDVLDFEAKYAASEHEADENSIDLTSHSSPYLALINKAAIEWWSTADPDDRATHPKKSEVAAWLVERGFTPTLAEQAATIIRPEWAAKGRPADK